MADTMNAEDAALARLEAALNRIAHHAQASAEPSFDPAPVTTRLDSLIAQLRAGLTEAPPGPEA